MLISVELTFPLGSLSAHFTIPIKVFLLVAVNSNSFLSQSFVAEVKGSWLRDLPCCPLSFWALAVKKTPSGVFPFFALTLTSAETLYVCPGTVGITCNM